MSFVAVYFLCDDAITMEDEDFDAADNFFFSPLHMRSSWQAK